MILADRFEEIARTAPGRCFVHFTGADAEQDEILNYGEGDRRASSVAAELLRRGIGRGDIVVLMMPNCAGWLVWYIGNQKVGAVTCGVNTELLASELAPTLVNIDPRLIVTVPELAGKARAVIDEGRLSADLLVLGHDAVPEAEPRPRDPTLDQSDLCSIIFTSGTTGARSKAVMVPHRLLMTEIRSYHELLRYGPEDHIMIVTPLFHAAALNWAVSLVLHCGGSIVLTEKFSASRFWEQADRSRATVLWTMAAIPFILMRSPVSEAERRAAPRLRSMFAVGAGDRWREIVERWGPILVDGFGMGETPGTLTGPDSFEHNEPFPCVGRPVPGVDLRIIDPDTGETLPPRVRGEIVVRFGQGFAGYLNNPEAMAEAVRDGWFHTGDIAYRDESGRIFFVDRIKDIIRRGSENISAREIEQALMLHSEVAEAYAVAKPHYELGEVIAAYLVAKDPARVFALDEIRDFCSQYLSRIKLPEDVRTVESESLPRTPTGRVQKFRLKEQLRGEQGLPA